MHRAIEELIVGGADDVVVRRAVGVAADSGSRQLGEARREVDLGVRIVGFPADTGRLAPDLRVREPADDECAVRHVRRRIARRESALAEEPLRVDCTSRQRHHRADGECREQQPDAAGKALREVNVI